MSEHAPIVVVFPRGQLSSEDKAAMRDAGVIAVEADDPKRVTQLRLSAPLSTSLLTGDAIVRAALKAIAGQDPETDAGKITSIGRAAHAFIKTLSAGIEEQQP
jgi:hypothetical protein